MHYDTTSIRSAILSARSHCALFSSLSDDFWAKAPGGKRGMVKQASKLRAQLEIRLSCDLYEAEALARKANPAVNILTYEKAVTRLATVRAFATEMGLGPTHRDYRALWAAIVARLDSALPNWLASVDGIGQLPAVRRRAAGHEFTDAEILEAFIKGALSGIRAPWGTAVEPALPHLPGVFHGFDLEWLAGLSNAKILFIQLSALGVTGQWLAPRLGQLIEAARVLLRRTEQYGSVEHYLQALLADLGDSAIELAFALGAGSKHKLPGFGVPTAAEALKHCGFDLAKPDIHVNRALGVLAIAGFEQPEWASNYGTPPDVRPEEMRFAMLKMEDIANCVGVETVLVDNAIWLLCSDKRNGGLHLTNGAIEEMGDKA